MSILKPVIRDMNHEDIPLLVKNDRIVLGHTLGEETYRFELNNNPFAHYFFLEDENTGNFLGMISLWIDSPTAQIINLYIMPEFQGNKLSIILMDFMCDYVKSFDVTEISLEVRTSNKRATSLYEKYGFKQVAIRREYYDNGEDAFLMLKRM